jgi:iron complex outermembrane receptor protein
MKTSGCTFLALFLFTAGLTAADSTTSPPTANTESDVVQLDRIVVSAGPDEKSLFDLAQATSILTGDALRRQTQQTLGETLAGTAGVNSTYYGPGASRPIIRGLGGDRIRMLANSVGTLDASNISPDHNVAVEPLFASSIEVLRGPATMLYGSSAVGGVVNVIENRIPLEAGDGHAHGALELRAWGPANERAGVLALDAGNSNFAFQLDAMRQKTDDIDIPGVARIDEEAPAGQPAGTIPNTASDTKDFSLGATWFGKAGHFGASVKRYETFYGVPNGEEVPVSIDLHQTRFDFDGEITQPFGAFRGAHLRFGVGQYEHRELDGEEVGTAFNNDAWEGRLELPHVAVGPFTGTIGLQTSRSDFSAIGEEVVTPPSVTSNHAIFALEEMKVEGATVQFGLRHEIQRIQLGDVPDDLPIVPGYAAQSHELRHLNGTSASAGVVVHPAKDYALGFTLAYTERLPTAQEIFSNGPHGGTAAYEIGSAALEREKSLGFDVSLRKRDGFLTGSVSAFANRFNGYIFELALPADAIPETINPEGLTPYQFVARDAMFYGGEAEITLHLLDGKDQRLHLEMMSDYVHAKNTTYHEPLPRIPALRFGTELRYQSGRWQMNVGARHTFKQDRFTASESATPGYTLVSAAISYEVPFGRSTCELFARGENLTDAEARVHTSFLKDFAPLPGRGVLVGARWVF